MASKNKSLAPVSPFVEKASKQVDRLTDIINELLDVTKIQAGKLELVKTDFLLQDLIEECIENCLVDNHTHQITVNGNKELCINADKNRIEQVICNLLTNAIKYSPKSQQVIVAFEASKSQQVKFAVTDHGIGIPEDKIEEVFDRFFRVEKTSQNFSGLGLGLYISSEIIKRHQGEIGAYSKLGEGSTFWFTV